MLLRDILKRPLLLAMITFSSFGNAANDPPVYQYFSHEILAADAIVVENRCSMLFLAMVQSFNANPRFDPDKSQRTQLTEVANRLIKSALEIIAANYPNPGAERAKLSNEMDRWLALYRNSIDTGILSQEFKSDYNACVSLVARSVVPDIILLPMN